MSLPDVASREQWLAARRRLLAQEKELTRGHDALNASRRRLPMVKVDQEYVFEGPGRPGHAGRTLRGQAAADRPARHVRSRLGPALPGLLGQPSTSSRRACSPTWGPGRRPSCWPPAPPTTRSPRWPRSGAGRSRGTPATAATSTTTTRSRWTSPAARSSTTTGPNPACSAATGPARCRATAASCARAARSSTPTRFTAGAPSMLGNAYTFLDMTALGRQEDWEEPKGRVAPVRGGDPTFTS